MRQCWKEHGGQECRCRCNNYVPKPLLSSYVHTMERLKSHHCLRTLTQILAPSFTIKRTTTPLILYLPLPAGWTTLQYHRMKCNPSEKPVCNVLVEGMLLYLRLYCHVRGRSIMHGFKTAQLQTSYNDCYYIKPQCCTITTTKFFT